ncbi:MAG: DUF6088 family protein [Hyphomicrobiales bacterium]|nr:DUF6088 family protein [Hyphomicrobiales bacterium]MCY4038586.1 DUF6088 family protein [Hyphomicrobiales bacterium]
MKTLTKAIMEYAEERPEGEVIHAKALLHLGSRATVDKALSRLAERGQLLRVHRGFYVRLLEGRLGDRFLKYPPSVHLVTKNFARAVGEFVLPIPSATANVLGLTTQNPMRIIYITSGPSRWLKFGDSESVELRHASRWYFSVGDRTPGRVLRVAGWEGSLYAADILHKLKNDLSPSDLREMADACPKLPSWLAKEVSEFVANG